jgi:hypothetical protein
VGGKKHIIAESQKMEVAVGIDKGMVGRQAQMGEGDEDRPDEDENSDAFDHERNFVRFPKQEKDDEYPEHSKAFKKNKIHVEHRNVVQNDIGHIFASSAGDIDIGKIVDD